MRAVLFDFGGTLDSNGLACKDVFYSIYASVGLSINHQDFDRAFYNADDNLPIKHNLKNLGFEDTFKLQIKDVLENLQIKSDDIAEKILKSYLTETRNFFKQNIEVLSELKKNYKLAVISNFFGNLESVLKSENLSKYFDVLVDSSIIGAVKPDPKIFNHTLEKLGVKAEDALMVGDSVERDIKGAAALGFKTALLWGDRKEKPPTDLTNTIILNNLTELPLKIKEVSVL